MTTAHRQRLGRLPSLTGTAAVVRLALRSSWPQLLFVVVIAAGLVTATAGSIDALYPSLAEREQYAATVGESPAVQAFNGRGYALETVGGIAAYEIGFIGQLLFPLLALHIALRHTRREEEAGRTELLTAARVGRLAPLAAGTVVLVTVSGFCGVLMWAGMVASSLTAAGAGWYASGTALLMLFYGGIGLLLGQLAQSSRTGYLAGLAVITGTYLVRALVDGLQLDAVWASPLGWYAELRAFAEPQLWPLVALFAAAALLCASAVWVAAGRDIGAGVLAPRAGPARAGSGLASIVGLTWRLNRTAIIAWAVLAVVWAAVFGTLTREMADLVDANPALLDALQISSGSDVVTSLAVVVVVLAATGLAVQCYGRLAAEESSGRLGALLATGTHRWRLWLKWWAVVTGASVLVLALGCLALGLATWAVLDDAAAMRTAAQLAAGYLVPVVFIGAAAGMLRAVGGGLSGVAWLLVGWVAVVGFLADTLQLAEWSRSLSPLHLVGELPQEEPDMVATVALGMGVLLLVAGSAVTFQRRDLSAG